MKGYIAPALVVAYLLGGLVTFGHAYNTRPATYTTWNGQIVYSTQGQRTVDSIVCAVLWPLYASATVWEGKA